MTRRFQNGPHSLWSVMALLLCLIVSGCTGTLDSKYVAPRSQSINGIVSFIDLLKRTNRKVDVWPGVSPQMMFQYQTLIVFHNGYDELPAELVTHLSSMIELGSIENLFIVVRDSDSAIEYWRQIAEQSATTAAAKDEAVRAQKRHEATLRSSAQGQFEPGKGKWYGLKVVDRSAESPLKSIEYQIAPQLASIEARWPLNRRLQPTESAEILWHVADDPLLTVEQTDSAAVFVLASATPLLNGGFADAGNRRLAADLVGRIPESDRVAIAISSRWFDDSDLQSPSIWRFLQVHPNGWVFGQAIVALLLFCWWKFPIFGRPQTVISTEPVRFGRHVEALGHLLQRTRNVEYARQRIRDWIGRDASKRDSKEPSPREKSKTGP